MMFDYLITSTIRALADFNFELSRTMDVYRLEQLLLDHERTISWLHLEAAEMVKELEDIDNE
jgi:hypothetical protein